MKKLYLSMILLFVAFSSQAQFTNLWTKMANGNDYTWFNNITSPNAGFNVNNVVSLAYNPVTDKLLVSSRNSQIYIINPATGAEEGMMNVSGMGSEAFKFNKIRVTTDGVIYGISLATGAGQCKIYRWANQASAPTLAADFTVTERCGDAFGLAGTGSSTVLYASGSGTTATNFNIYILNGNGTNFVLESKVTMASSPTANEQWSNRTVEPETVGVNSAIWIKGSGTNLLARKISVGPNVGGVRTGTVVTTIADGTAAGQAAREYGGMRLLTLPNGRKYLGFAGGNSNVTSTTMRLLDVTNEASITTYGTSSAGDVATYQLNGNGTGDVSFKDNGDGTHTVFSLATNNYIWAAQSGYNLPVELSSFTAALNKEVVQLRWSTSSESNNKGFEIERSVNGKEFSSIGFVTSKGDKGNSADKLTYEFNDTRTVRGSVYYRLKQTDLDGKYRYSSIEKVAAAAGEKFTISVLGNPVRDNVVLFVSNTSERVLSVQVANASGAVVLNKQYRVASGDANINISVKDIPAGLLYVTIADNETRQVIRVMKQ